MIESILAAIAIIAIGLIIGTEGEIVPVSVDLAKAIHAKRKRNKVKRQVKREVTQMLKRIEQDSRKCGR